MQVFAVEFVTFAIDFVLFAVEFVPFAIEFGPFGIELQEFNMFAIKLGNRIRCFCILNRIGSCRKHENKMLLAAAPWSF